MQRIYKYVAFRMNLSTTAPCSDIIFSFEKQVISLPALYMQKVYYHMSDRFSTALWSKKDQVFPVASTLYSVFVSRVTTKYS